jgi:MFS family permease
MNPRERKILTVTCFGHFLSHFNMLVFPAILMPLSSRLGMDMGEVLGLSFWMYLLFGLTALPWGVATDRYGAVPFLFLFFAGAGAGGLAAALFIDSPAALAVCLATIGLFSGIYHPAGLGWISKEIDRVSLGMAYNGIFGNLGLALAPLLAGVVNWLWGVKAVYVAVGALNLSGAAMLLLAPTAESPGETRAKPSQGSESVRGFLILLGAMMLGGVAYRGATVILPAYFELKNTGIFDWLSGFFSGRLSENLVATTVTSVIFIIGMAGQYTGGRMAERFEQRRLYLIFHALPIPVALLMALLTDVPLVILAVIYFFFLLGMQPIENTLVARFTPRQFHHAAYGTKFVLTFGVGALAVKMIEVIRGGYGIEAVFPALAAVSLGLVGVILILMRYTPRMDP